MSSPDGTDPPLPVPRCVLVIDDEPRSTAGAIMEMRLRGMNVDAVRTKQEAETALAGKAYDAVLLDLMLPEREAGEPKSDPPLSRHGFDVLDRLRGGAYEQGGTQADVPVAVITGIGSEVSEVAQDLKARSIDQVFVKPATPVLVAETLVDAMEEKQSC